MKRLTALVLAVLLVLSMVLSAVSPAFAMEAPKDSLIGVQKSEESAAAKTEASPFENDRLVSGETADGVLNLRDNAGYIPNVEETEMVDVDGKWVVTCANGCEYTYSDNGDGTHTATCSVCGHKVTEEHSTEKDENKATCQHGNICDLCGVEYSEPDPDAHSYNEDGFCEMCSTANPDETMFFIFDGDHKAFNVAEDLVGVNIEYTRGLHNTEWNSLYLPFEVPVTEGLLDEFEFAYVNDMHSADTDDNGEIDEIEMEIVKIKTGTLHANHPYFIRAKSEYTILQLSCENTTLHATKETTLNCSSIYMDYAIVGSYKHIKGTEFASMPADRYYAISIDGGWWQIPEDSSLYPFRAYLSMTARDGSPVKVSDEAMRSIRIREKGEGTTDIEEVKGENGEVNSEIYDLSGRRVMLPQKGGVYIVGGKKIVY